MLNVKSSRNVSIVNYFYAGSQQKLYADTFYPSSEEKGSKVTSINNEPHSQGLTATVKDTVHNSRALYEMSPQGATVRGERQ